MVGLRVREKWKSRFRIQAKVSETKIFRFQDESLTRFNRNIRRKSLNIFFGFANDASAANVETSNASTSGTPTSEGTFTKWKRKIQRKVISSIFGIRTWQSPWNKCSNFPNFKTADTGEQYLTSWVLAFHLQNAIPFMVLETPHTLKTKILGWESSFEQFPCWYL